MLTPVFLCLTLFTIADGDSARIKSDAKEAGREVGHAAKKVGHVFKKAGKKVGHTAKEGGKEVGHAATEFGHGVKETVKGEK